MKKLYTSLFLLILISFGIQGFTSIHFHRSIFPSFSTKEITIDSLLINTYNNTLLSQFYKENQYQTVWTNKSQRETLIEEISKAEEDGLQTTDYNYYKLKNWEQQFSSLADSIVVRYDLLLTISIVVLWIV